MLEFRSFGLDESDHTVWKFASDGRRERVHLTPKAFDILHYLASNSPRVISSNELIGAIWQGVHVEPAVIKGHVLSIRRALDDDPREPVIVQTIRGRGYRFIGAPADTLEVPGPLARHFVGRDLEIRMLISHLRASLQQGPRLVFVTGEAGIGKTALVDATVREAHTTFPQLQVAYGQCVEGFAGRDVYHPILEILSAVGRGPGGKPIQEKLASIAPTWLAQLPEFQSGGQRAALLREVTGATSNRMLREGIALFASIAAESPLLLVIEDLHWADYSTIDLLSALVRSRARFPLLVVATCRPSEAYAAGHPLTKFRADALLHRLAEEIPLPALDAAGVESYLRREVDGGHVPPGLSRLIHVHSGGNPLFIGAILDNLTRLSRLERKSSGWWLQQPPDRISLDVPRTVGEAVDLKINALSPSSQTVLELTSLTERGFRADINSVDGDIDAEAFEQICETLLRETDFHRRTSRSHFPGTVGSQSYEFRQEMFRSAVAARQPPIRRARRHKLVGERLEQLLGDKAPAFASELAGHFAAGREWEKAIRYKCAAAENAMRRFAQPAAATILLDALALVRNLPADRELPVRLELQERLGTVYAGSSDPGAESAYSAMLDLATDIGDVDAQARAIAGLIYVYSWTNVPRCLEAIQDGLNLSARQTDPVRRASTRFSCYAWRFWVNGSGLSDFEEVERALADIGNGHDKVRYHFHLMEYGYLLLLMGRYQEGHDLVQSNYDALLAAGASRYDFNLGLATWMVHLGVPWLLTGAGELQAAFSEFDRRIEQLQKNGEEYRSRALASYRAWAQLQLLDYEGALATVGAAKDGLPGAPLNAPRTLLPAEERAYLVAAGLALSGLGRDRDAMELLLRAREAMQQQRVILDWFWRIQLELGLAELYLSRSELPSAAEHAELAMEFARDAGGPTSRAWALELRARIFLANGDSEHASTCLEKALALVERFGAPLAGWRVHFTSTRLAYLKGDQGAAHRHKSSGVQALERLGIDPATAVRTTEI